MVSLSSALLLAGLAAFGCGDDDDTGVATQTAPASAESPTRVVPTPISLATIIIDDPPAVANGDVFALRVRIAGATNLGAYQLTPQYDRDALVLLDVRDGGFIGSTGRTPTCSKEGAAPAPVTLFCVTAGSEPAGPSGDGNLAVLEFRAQRSGASDVGFERITITTPDGTEVPIAAQGAAVTVQ
jgi:hypothetical protein